MDTNTFTSIEIKDSLSKLYEDSISSISRIIEKIGKPSPGDIFKSFTVTLVLDGNYICPRLIRLPNGDISFQIREIKKYLLSSKFDFKIYLIDDKNNSIELPLTMNVSTFPYGTQSDFLPTISILRSLEYIESALT